MELKAIKKYVAAGIILALALALIPSAMADGKYDMHGGMDCRKDTGKDCGMHGDWMKSHDIDRIDIVKTITGMNDGRIMFDVPGMAITDGDGKVVTVTFAKPLKGIYDYQGSMGFVGTRDMDSATIMVDKYANASLNVTGASMIATIKDIKNIEKEKDTVSFEYSKIGVYLPDGTARMYKLDKPVRVMYSRDRNIMAMDAYPSIMDTLGTGYTAGMMFPSDTPPMKIKDIAAAQKSYKIQTIGTAPRLMPMPTATPAPTPIPTATPTEVPVPTATP